jgi:hypothetical protein
MFHNIFLLALIAPIIAIIITKAYDKFEKKDYPTKTYIQIGTLSYLSGAAMLYISKLLMCSSGTRCPWSPTESSSIGTNTASNPSTSNPAQGSKITSAGLFEKVLKTVSQVGGGNPNVLANPSGELFHTGAPTF